MLDKAALSSALTQFDTAINILKITRFTRAQQDLPARFRKFKIWNIQGLASKIWKIQNPAGKIWKIQDLAGKIWKIQDLENSKSCRQDLENFSTR